MSYDSVFLVIKRPWICVSVFSHWKQQCWPETRPWLKKGLAWQNWSRTLNTICSYWMIAMRSWRPMMQCLLVSGVNWVSQWVIPLTQFLTGKWGEMGETVTQSYLAAQTMICLPLGLEPCKETVKQSKTKMISSTKRHWHGQHHHLSACVSSCPSGWSHLPFHIDVITIQTPGCRLQYLICLIHIWFNHSPYCEHELYWWRSDYNFGSPEYFLRLI